jgi:hypothetical protein
VNACDTASIPSKRIRICSLVGLRLLRDPFVNRKVAMSKQGDGYRMRAIRLRVQALAENDRETAVACLTMALTLEMLAERIECGQNLGPASCRNRVHRFDA